MTEVERRLALLEDRIAISELRSKYCWHTVRAQRQEVLDLFTDDAVFQNTRNAQGGPPLTVTGRAALQEFFTRLEPARRVPLVMNEVVTIDGDEAEGTCAMLSVGADGFCGHYIDNFRRVQGKWLFSRRQFFPYWPTYNPAAGRVQP